MCELPFSSELILIHFTTLSQLQRSRVTKSKGNVTIRDEFVRMWKNEIVVCFKAAYYPSI
jgi:hypothetical protein